MLRRAVVAGALLAAVPHSTVGAPLETLVLLRAGSSTSGVLETAGEGAVALIPGPSKFSGRILVIPGEPGPWLSHPDVLYAGLNREIPLPAMRPGRSYSDDSGFQQGAADPLYAEQHALRELRAETAWELTRGAGVLVAIVDTGVDLDHPDLQPNLYINELEASGLPGVDDDGNGYVDDVTGYDFTDAPGLPGIGDYLGRDADPDDDHGHGTIVSGVVAAVRNNGIGIAGLAPEAVLLPVRAGFGLSLPLSSGILQEDDAAAGIVYAADQGADVICLSWGDDVDSPIIRAAIEYAQSQGALVAAASGNSGSAMLDFPARHPGVLAVGASVEGRRAGFSNHGPGLDLLAPGVDVLTTVVDGAYGRYSGTSLAAPLAAGCAALVRSANRHWNPLETAWAMRIAAPGGNAHVPEAELGYGLADAAASLEPFPHSRPPVLALEPVATSGLWHFSGSVQGPSILNWHIQASNGAETLESPLGYGPRVGKLWEVEANSSGEWIVRISAEAGGYGALELVQPFTAPTSPELVGDISGEFQVSEGSGWDWLAVWETQVPAVGFAVSVSAYAEAASFGVQHRLRLAELPSDFHETVSIQARTEEGAEVTLGVLDAVVPPTPAPSFPEERTVPAGTPMEKAVDMDGDGLLDVVLESPPMEDTYGRVVFVEAGEAVLGEAFGIPVDAADWNESGRPELVVFQGSGWSVYTASSQSAYPCSIQAQGPGVPLGFMRLSSGISLAVAAGGELRLYEADGEYRGFNVGSVPATKALIADLVGADGLDELCLADLAGALHVFQASGDDLIEMPVAEAPVPLRFEAAAVSGPAPSIITLEVDPPNAETEADFTGATTRMRRWTWSGSEWRPGTTAALAGAHPQAELVSRGERIWFVRGQRVDEFTVGEDLSWTGTWELSLDRAAGVGAVIAPGSSSDVLWVGGFQDSAGKTYALETPALGRGGLRVTSALMATETRLAVALENAGGCPWNSVMRTGGGEPSRTWSDANSVADTLTVGREYRYEAASPGCAPAVLSVRAHNPREYHAERRLRSGVIHLDQPVSQRGRVVGPSGTTLGVALDQDARRLVIPLDGLDSVPLMLEGFILQSGLPLGGGMPFSVVIPPFAGAAPLRISEAHYDPGRLSLTLAPVGEVLCADPRIRIEPEGIEVSGALDETVWIFQLESQLAPGMHTAEVLEVCSGPAYAAIDFAASAQPQVYPNPVLPGGRLTVNGITPGTELTLVDSAGRRVVREVMDGPGLVAVPESLAPGLYLLRIAVPGADVQWQRVGVVR